MEPVPFIEYQVEAAGAWGVTQGEEKLPNREDNSSIEVRLRASSSSAKTAPPPASKSLKRKSVSNPKNFKFHLLKPKKVRKPYVKFYN